MKIRLAIKILCLTLGVVCIAPSPANAGAKLSITPTGNNVFLLIRMSRRQHQRIHARGWKTEARLWLRRSTGWARVGRKEFYGRQWTRAVRTRRICRRSYGKIKMVMQLGVRKDQYWWNPTIRRWQTAFQSINQTIGWIDCGSLPDDMPPGSLPTPGRVVAPANPSMPPAQPAQPAQPVSPPQAAPAPAAPSLPPPPVIIGKRKFRSFLRSLRRNSFDKNRYRALRSWLRRVGKRKIRAYQAQKLLKSFSFDSTRSKAARALSRFVLRPLTVRQVILIIKPFSFRSNKVEAALAYCRDVKDKLNIHLLVNQFSFSSDKSKIRQECR